MQNVGKHSFFFVLKYLKWAKPSQILDLMDLEISSHEASINIMTRKICYSLSELVDDLIKLRELKIYYKD